MSTGKNTTEKTIKEYEKHWDNFNVALYALFKQIKKNGTKRRL